MAKHSPLAKRCPYRNPDINIEHIEPSTLQGFQLHVHQKSNGSNGSTSCLFHLARVWVCLIQSSCVWNLQDIFGFVHYGDSIS